MKALPASTPLCSTCFSGSAGATEISRKEKKRGVYCDSIMVRDLCADLLALDLKFYSRPQFLKLPLHNSSKLLKSSQCKSPRPKAITRDLLICIFMPVKALPKSMYSIACSRMHCDLLEQVKPDLVVRVLLTVGLPPPGPLPYSSWARSRPRLTRCCSHQASLASSFIRVHACLGGLNSTSKRGTLSLQKNSTGGQRLQPHGRRGRAGASSPEANKGGETAELPLIHETTGKSHHKFSPRPRRVGFPVATHMLRAPMAQSKSRHIRVVA